MDDLIVTTLNSLDNASKLIHLKVTLKTLLEGLKDFCLENANLKKEINEKNERLSALEAVMKTLQDEKVDLVTSIDANSSAIKSLEDKAPHRESVSPSSQDKDEKISKLEQTITTLENKLDATEAYERRDSIIISGAVPNVAQGREENSIEVAVDIIKKKLTTIEIDPKDISVAHRLQSKPSSDGSSPRPPNMYVKLVRRELKKQLITASKGQTRSTDRIFINDSLTPQRNAVFRTLQRIRKDNNVIKGVSSFEGEVYAYTARPSQQGAGDGQSRTRNDLRHRINTKDQLRRFCDEFVKNPLEDFVVSWPRL